MKFCFKYPPFFPHRIFFSFCMEKHAIKTRGAHSFVIQHKLCLTQIAVNWVEIIRIICADWAFVDSQVNRGYVSMAALNETSQWFAFQILISSLPKLICSGNQDEIFNKNTESFPMSLGFDRLGPRGHLVTPWCFSCSSSMKPERPELIFLYSLLSWKNFFSSSILTFPFQRSSELPVAVYLCLPNGYGQTFPASPVPGAGGAAHGRASRW